LPGNQNGADDSRPADGADPPEPMWLPANQFRAHGCGGEVGADPPEPMWLPSNQSGHTNRAEPRGRCPVDQDGAMGDEPTIVLVTGPPGTGKSTLASAAATMLAAPVLGWDWVMAGLTPFEGVQQALAGLDHVGHRRVGWSILWNLAEAQARDGRSSVLDGCARQVEVDETRARAEVAAARCAVVTTRCTDAALHRRRIEARTRAIPGWYELDWDHVAGFLGRWAEPTGADLRLDAADPLSDNVDRLAAALAPQRAVTARPG
jgi:predicted kinase